MASIINIAKKIRESLSLLYLVGDIKAFTRGVGYDFEPVAGALTNVQTTANNVITALDDLDSAVNTLLDLNDPFGADAHTASLEFIRAVGSIAVTHSALKSVGASFSAPGLNTHISEIMGGSGNAQTEFAEEFLARSVGLVVCRYLGREYPVAKEFLEIIGVLQSVEQLTDTAKHRIAFTEYKVNWQGISDFVTNPQDYIQTLYRWGVDSVALNRLLDRLQWLSISKMIPASVVYVSQNELSKYESIVNGTFPPDVASPRSLKVLLWEDEASGLRIEVRVVVIPSTTAIAAPGIGFALVATVNSQQEIYLSQNLLLVFDGGADLNAGLYLALMPDQDPAFDVQLPDAALTRTSLEIKTARRSSAQPSPLIGSIDGSRLEIGSIDGLLGIEIVKDQAPELYGELQLNDGKIVIKIGEGDGFIQKILPDLDVNAAFDITIGWSTERSLYLRGSGGIEIIIPIHLSLGPIKIQTIYLAVELSNQGDIHVSVAVTASLELGPIQGSIDRIGLRARYSFPQGGGNQGPLQLDSSFKPPLGAGLALSAGGIVGGGFLEFDDPNKRYAGILALNFGEIGLTAIGLITTRMPDGSKGFSLLVNIGVVFSPPIGLPYGFTLSGVGGLIGVNRSMQVDVLRAGLKNRTLDSILFPDPDTVIANASKIISDLRAVFPPTEGQFVVGPMVKFGWGANMITADVGIFLELPDPIRVVLLGQVQVLLPEEKNGIVVIHLDILGVLDFEKAELTFQASMYDSRILTYPIFGDSAFLLSWGEDPRFALSIGGFHPKFTPPPPPVLFAELRRLTLSIDYGSHLQLICQAYQALTPNSLQFGARVDLYASQGDATVTGMLGYDALIYFSPFTFEAVINGGVQIRYKGKSLADVDLSLILTGPAPWVARGKAKIKILFASVNVRFCFTWGREQVTLPPVDPWGPLQEALGTASNWGSVLPAQHTLVETVRGFEEDAPEQIIVHPTGRFEVRQNVVPLGVSLDKAGSAPITGHDLFDIGDVTINGESLKPEPVEEFFARGQFEALTDHQKLSVPSFEKMKGGVTTALRAVRIDGAVEDKPLAYESILIKPDRTAQGQQPEGHLEWEDAKFIAAADVRRRAIGRAGPRKRFAALRSKAKVRVGEERYCIAHTADLTRATLSPTLAQENSNLSRVKADQVLKAQLALDPEQAETLIVIPEYEIYKEAA